MNLENDDIEIDEILYRYFRKELSVEEAKDVDDWRNRNSENQEQFEKAQWLFLDLKGVSYYKTKTSGVDQSWQKFANDHSIKSIKPLRRFSGTFLKYAASILLIISTVFAVYYFQNQPTNVEIAGTDQAQEISLPDQSVVSLDQDASISYKQPFQNNERRVLLKGNAYFSVTKNTDQPFVVDVDGTEIRVLGTKFYVLKNDENALTVNVDEGRVLLSHKNLHQIVDEGSSIKVDMAKNVLIETTDKTGASTFWKNKRLIFNLTSVEEAIRAINQAYQTNIQLEGDTEQCYLTVTFENESIENVLEVISSTLNYEIVENQGNFTLLSNGCQ